DSTGETRDMRLFIALLVLVGGSFAAADGPKPTVVAAQIDRLIEQKLSLSPSELAPPVNDATFLRRVYLDLLGTIPTPGEVRAFIADDHPHKRRRLVNDLLQRPEYGVSQARYWRDVILSRRLEDRAIVVGPALVE